MKMVLNRKGTTALLLCLAAGCARPAPSSRPSERVERTAYVMGTMLRVEVVAGSRAAGLEAAELAFGEVRRLEEVLSSWRSDTEVGRINAAEVGRPVRVEPELWGMLVEARGWSERTGGAFDPAVGALIDAWELRGAGRRPGEAELERALAASGLAVFRFDDRSRTVARLDAGAWLDTGGFGKGAALRAADGALRRAGVEAALLDFGGQVLALGAPDGTGAWRVRVAHPSRRDEAVMELRLRDASVATTSQSERFVEVDGERWGHVLDPRTGRPVPAWGSVTVVAADPLAADALSTALFVMGPQAARAWAEGRSGVGVLVLEEREGGVAASWNAEFEEYLSRSFLP